MADSGIGKLPLMGQLAIALGLSAVGGFLFYYFLWSPMAEEEDKKTKALQSLQQEIRSLEVTAAKLQEFQREVQVREVKLERLKLILPPQKETPELMHKVQYLAAQSSLQIRRFEPMATITRDFPQPGQTTQPGAPAPPPPPPPAPGTPQQPRDTYQEWPINVDLDGSYHNLGAFLDRVGRLARLVNVGNIRIKTAQNQKPSGTIQASCVATTFVYVEASPLPGPPPAPGAPR